MNASASADRRCGLSSHSGDGWASTSSSSTWPPGWSTEKAYHGSPHARRLAQVQTWREDAGRVFPWGMREARGGEYRPCSGAVAP